MTKKPAKKPAKKAKPAAPKLNLWKLSSDIEEMSMRAGQLGGLLAILAQHDHGEMSEALWLIADLLHSFDQQLMQEAERIMEIHRQEGEIGL